MRKLFVIASLCLTASFSEAAIARVQVAIGSVDAGSSTNAPFLSNVASGNLIVVFVSCYYGEAQCNVGNTATVTDTLGNTYTLASNVDDSTTDAVPFALAWAYYAVNISGGANTVTFSSVGNSSYFLISAIEYSGVATSSPLDVTAKSRYFYTYHGFVQTPTYTSGSASPSEAGELLVAMHNDQSSGNTFTPDSGWTQISQNTLSIHHEQQVQERVIPSAGSYQSSGSLGTSQNIVTSIMLGFKAAGGGGAPAKSGTIPLLGV